MAEKEQEQRHSRENKRDATEARDSGWGLRAGLAIGIVAILGGCFCAYVGQAVPSVFIGGGGIVGLVSVFIYGSRAKPSQAALLPPPDTD